MLSSTKNIPKTLHFCYGLTSDPFARRWSLMNHVCVMSAISAIRPERVLFHHDFAPTGPWWPLTAPHVECVKVTAPREIFGRPLHHPAHRADVLRLRILQEHGGIYLDTDVFVHRDFDDLLDYDVVMGREGGAEAPRLCNAVILARAGAPFLERWYAQYRSFRSRGIDEYWIEHSVVLPFKLMQQHPDEITALPHDAFHWPGPTPEEVALLFGPWPGREVRSLYANHLWAQLAVRYTWDLTPGYVRQVDSVFHRWARPFIADLPDDYGKPDLLFRARRRLRHIRRKLVAREERGTSHDSSRLQLEEVFAFARSLSGAGGKLANPRPC